MKWATGTGIHIDRSACAWLLRRSINPDAEFAFVARPDDLLPDAIPFDMRGVEFGKQGNDCTFETRLRRNDIADPVLWRRAEIVHEADLDDARFDAPEAAGLDTVPRGLSMVVDDHQVLEITGPLFDGLYEFSRRELLLGKAPS